MSLAPQVIPRHGQLNRAKCWFCLLWQSTLGSDGESLALMCKIFPLRQKPTGSRWHRLRRVQGSGYCLLSGASPMRDIP